MSSEQKISKWFDAKVAATVFIVSTTMGVVNYFMSPVRQLDTQVQLIQQEVSIIQSNHLKHLEEDVDSLENHYFELDRKMERVLTILEKNGN